ncbi:hypothetical protein [Diaphorobacter aerolatus]|uniref:hypothetical protein n=1 Tax=Diaphorobacter aerolatus TaxID=1288495 RepID=UPI00299F70A8|nr:hypothetical protein [Diaphorobacter aerolatus]
MPMGGTDEGSAERIAFHTRMVTPPPPAPEPVSEPEAAPAAAKPAQPAAPKPRPRPRPAVPRKAPPPDAEETPEPIHEAQEAPDNAPQIEPPEPPTTRQEAASAPERIAPEPMPSASDASPAVPAPAAASAASAPASPDDELSAGVDIRPPGAAGAHASTEPPPIRLPASVTLHYAVHGEVKKMAYNVSGQLQWKNEGSRYEASQEVSAFLLGTRSQKSTGAITPNGLAPIRFGDKGRKEVAAHFDFDQRVVTYSANTPRAPSAPERRIV